MGDHRIDLDLLLHVPVDDFRHIGAPARAAEPIKIGFSMPLTGGLAGGGKSVILAFELWKEDINAKGGLIGRPVELVYYDDQSTPSQVPGIYSKLLDIDKVDFVISSYATNQIAPAMPIVISCSWRCSAPA
jgi:branched-chain amino acid transport system substrate-binding protein